MKARLLRIAGAVVVVSLLVLGLRPETGAVPAGAGTMAMAAYAGADDLADLLFKGDKRDK